MGIEQKPWSIADMILNELEEIKKMFSGFLL
jgi:hypothetical protein